MREHRQTRNLTAKYMDRFYKHKAISPAKMYKRKSRDNNKHIEDS